ATLAELDAEIEMLRVLEEHASKVRASGTDKKWDELSKILQSSEMRMEDGTKRKIIIFTEYKDTLEYLYRKISTLLGGQEGVRAIHSGVNREDRRRIQHQFTNQADVQVLVATDAAGEGVNLQR